MFMFRRKTPIHRILPIIDAVSVLSAAFIVHYWTMLRAIDPAQSRDSYVLQCIFIYFTLSNDLC
jgi:hypothetical protein